MGDEEATKLRNKAREISDNHRKLYGREHECSGYDKVPDGEEGLGFQYDNYNDVWNVPNESDAAGLDDTPSRYVIFFCPMCGQRLPIDGA